MATDQTQQQFLNCISENNGIIHKVCHLYCNTAVDRQDLFQEIVVQLWKAFPKFRNESRVSTWMYRIALNTAISDFRKQRRRVDSTMFEVAVALEIADEGIEERKEQLAMLRKAILYLTAVEKALLMLYLEEKSYEEMEEVMGMSQGNLRVKISRIKEKLRKNVVNL